ncbi:MAG TPA: PAS domain-containing protein, partial [Terracidiphilus sp.]|nr:PAS domain-containing protein [Terracidiphilus sp.]
MSVSRGLMPDRNSAERPRARNGPKARVRAQAGATEAAAALAILAVIACSLAADQARWPDHGYLAFMDMVAGFAAAALAFRALHRSRSVAPDSSLKNIFESSGPMILAIGLDGTITHMNPAAERILGYYAAELVGQPRTAEILAPGEGPRLIAELQRITGQEPDPDLAAGERLSVLMDTIRRMP